MPKEHAKRVIASDWFDRFARVGYAAKGMVFGMVGLLAIRVALGQRSEQADVAGALGELGDQPLKVIPLVVMAIGLTGYALWRLTQGVVDLEQEGSGFRGWVKRLGYVGVGLVYGGFAVYAVGILGGWSTDNDGIRDITAEVMSWPYGRWLVGGAGVAVIVSGLTEIYFAISRRFEVELGRDDLGTFERLSLLCTGGYGHLARGAVYCTAGFFAIRAALHFDPDDARGLADTFRELSTQPYGAALVIAGGSGFIAFGLYCTLLAFHRHIPNEGLMRGEVGD